MQVGITFLFFTLISSLSFARTNSIKDIDTVTVLNNVSIGTKAPTDWGLDNKTAQQYGLCAFYLPKGKTFHNAPAIIYPRIVGNFESIGALIEDSAKNYRSSKNFEVVEQKDITNKNGDKFLVRYFFNAPPPNQFEAVGYLKFKKNIFLLAYSAQNKKDFESHKGKFEEALDNVAPYSSDLSVFSGQCLYPKL